MGFAVIEGIYITPLKVIGDERGEVRHGLRASEDSFRGFGETYFSVVNRGVVKGWKKHLRMHSNLIVAAGSIRFVCCDDREGSPTRGVVEEYCLSRSVYGRLTIPPGIWMAFQGTSEGTNLLVNIASVEHDPNEVMNLRLDDGGAPRVDWERHPQGR